MGCFFMILRSSTCVCSSASCEIWKHHLFHSLSCAWLDNTYAIVFSTPSHVPQKTVNSVCECRFASQKSYSYMCYLAQFYRMCWGAGLSLKSRSVECAQWLYSPFLAISDCYRFDRVALMTTIHHDHAKPRYSNFMPSLLCTAIVYGAPSGFTVNEQYTVRMPRAYTVVDRAAENLGQSATMCHIDVMRGAIQIRDLNHSPRRFVCADRGKCQRIVYWRPFKRHRM